MSVRIVCARSNSHNASVGTSSGTKPDFPMIGGSIRSANEIMSSSLMSGTSSDRMFKAKSDGSISSSVADDTARDGSVIEHEQGGNSIDILDFRPFCGRILVVLFGANF